YIGSVYRDMGQLERAEEAYARALRAFEAFFQHVTDPTQLGEAQQTLSHFYERYAQVLLQLHRPDDALLKLERGRAQGLSRQIQLNGDNPTHFFKPQDVAELLACDTERRTARKLHLAAHNRPVSADPSEQRAFKKQIEETDARSQAAEHRYALLRE